MVNAVDDNDHTMSCHSLQNTAFVLAPLWCVTTLEGKKPSALAVQNGHCLTAQVACRVQELVNLLTKCHGQD